MDNWFTTGTVHFMRLEESPMRQDDAYRIKEALRARGFADVGVHRPAGADSSHGYIVVVFLCGRAIEMRTTAEVEAFVAKIEAALGGKGA